MLSVAAPFANATVAVACVFAIIASVNASLNLVGHGQRGGQGRHRLHRLPRVLGHDVHEDQRSGAYVTKLLRP
jgi:hypothetical protein